MNATLFKISRIHRANVSSILLSKCFKFINSHKQKKNSGPYEFIFLFVKKSTLMILEWQILCVYDLYIYFFRSFLCDDILGSWISALLFFNYIPTNILDVRNSFIPLFIPTLEQQLQKLLTWLPHLFIQHSSECLLWLETKGIYSYILHKSLKVRFYVNLSEQLL